MKITFILPPVNLSGGIRSNGMIAEGLLKRGHDILCICPARKKPTLCDQLRSLKKGKGWIQWQKRGQSHFDDIDVPLKITDHSAPIVASDVPDADIVVATWWETAEWVMRFPPSKGAKVYFIRHHEVHDYLPVERSKETYKFPFHKVTISNWLVDVIKQEYGDEEISLVPNSIDTKKYYSPPRKKQDIPTIGMMYSGKYWKGSDIAVKAFSLAAEKIPELKLLAFGTKEPKSNLFLPKQTKYRKNPPQNEIKDIYSSCDAWLFSSRVEGFGRPILEAMACRTPVIGTPAGAAPELLDQGRGYLVPHEDPKAMAEAIIKVCRLPEQEWQSQSEMAYRWVQNYTWDDAAELSEKAFERAIQRYEEGSLSF